MGHHVLWPLLASITYSALHPLSLVAGVFALFDHTSVRSTEEGQTSCAVKMYLAIV